MPRSPSRLARFPLLIAVAAALAFGGQAALAAPAKATCPYDPGSGQLGLACTVDPTGHNYCNKQCVRSGYPQGLCNLDGCCLCAY